MYLRMKRIKLTISIIFLISLICVMTAGASKVSFYANITAIEPIMEAFEVKTGIKGEYTRISTDKFLATVLTEFEVGKLLADVIQAPIPVLEILKERGVI